MSIAIEGKRWLINPWCDLLFFANLGWPILALAVMWGGELTKPTLSFWFLYFISTPHRWITLALVFLDPDRFEQRPRAFLGVGSFLVLLVAAVFLSTSTVALLLVIDFFWNSWHFAAQHSGILRIYGRAARPDVQTKATLEKVFLRVFLLFVLIRIAAFACGPSCWQSGQTDDGFVDKLQPILFGLERDVVMRWLENWRLFAENWLDVPMIALPAFLLLKELCTFRPAAIGKVIYLISVSGIYGCLLLALHRHQPQLAAGMALAIAFFHSIEYLAIVSWSVARKPAHSHKGAFSYLAGRWCLYLVAFMSFMAITTWMLDTRFGYPWLLVTIVVSFMHYAYDGMIWKAPKPARAVA